VIKISPYAPLPPLWLSPWDFPADHLEGYFILRASFSRGNNGKEIQNKKRVGRRERDKKEGTEPNVKRYF
jgi:hypothetical protein